MNIKCINLSFKMLRKALKNLLVADWSVIGGGGPPVRKQIAFFYEKKNMQNFLKRKIMQKYFVKFLHEYPLKPWKCFPISIFPFESNFFFL